MGVFSRIGDLFKSNVNDLVSRSEDPEKMLNQALIEMSYRLTEARKQVMVAVADERRLRKQWEAELELTQKWKDKAKLAVRHGDDELAKQALFRRKQHEELSDEFQRQWEQQKNGVDQLKLALNHLNTQIQEAKRKKNLLVAIKKRAEAQKLIQETLMGLADSSALDTFQRMEQRINQLEAEADAAYDMNSQMTGDVLSQRFAELEAASGVDMDLLELKEEMGYLPKSRSTQTPALEA